MGTIELRAGTAEAAVDPTGGGALVRLAVGGRDLLTDEGCFVMAPFAGRTGYGRFTFAGVEHELVVPERHAPHAIHGTARHQPWSIEAGGAAELRLRCDLGPDWPWAGGCEQSVRLLPDRIELALAVTSAGEPFPATLGWHPWFVKPAEVRVDADALLTRGPDHLPTGERAPVPAPGSRRLDDCFEGVRWPVVVAWVDGFELAVEATGCDHVVVFDEPEAATCVEPQTGPPDALRLGGYAVVTPEQPLRATTTWRWSTRS